MRYFYCILRTANLTFCLARALLLIFHLHFLEKEISELLFCLARTLIVGFRLLSKEIFCISALHTEFVGLSLHFLKLGNCNRKKPCIFKRNPLCYFCMKIMQIFTTQNLKMVFYYFCTSEKNYVNFLWI